MRGRDAGVVGLVMHSITLHRPQVASPGPSGRTNDVVGQAITACGGVAPRRWASVRGAVGRAAAGARLGLRPSLLPTPTCVYDVDPSSGYSWLGFMLSGSSHMGSPCLG